MYQRSFAAVLLSAAVLAGGDRALAEEKIRPDTTGFYPLWEGTGHVERHAEVHLGTTGAQIGLGDLAHAGVQPLGYLYRMPNAYLKMAVLDLGAWHVAAQLGAFHLLPGAGQAFYSPMFSSRIANRDFSLDLVPLSISASTRVGEWLELHQTATGVGIVSSGPVRNEIEPGYSAVAELNPRERHSLAFHLGEVGFGHHDLAFVGASYRYRSGWLELRAGYFYRFTAAGAQGSPLVAIGVLL